MDLLPQPKLPELCGGGGGAKYNQEHQNILGLMT